MPRNRSGMRGHRAGSRTRVASLARPCQGIALGSAGRGTDACAGTWKARVATRPAVLNKGETKQGMAPVRVRTRSTGVPSPRQRDG